MTFGSLFSGIGGLDLGLERAGMVCKFQVEIDDYARRVLEKHWPSVSRFGDVRECGSHNLAPVDLIAGGFPCQDISDAGTREGIEGNRSGLWSEMFRIICEIRPRFVLVENVAALLYRGIDRVLGDLASVGYDAEWDCLPAAAFGAPHLRDRLFIAAYAWGQRGGARGAGRPSGGSAGATQQPYGIPLADAHCKPLVWASEPRPECSAWDAEPAICRVLDGVPARLVKDRLRGLGNAVVPQVAEYLGRQIMQASSCGYF